MRARGLKLHPDFARHVPIELGLSIAWQNVPYQLGGWADDWTCENSEESYRILLKREGQFWVAGDQVSFLSGWQEGAVRSAHHVIRGIANLPAIEEVPAPAMRKAPASKRKAPSIRRRTRGLP